jgi:BolA family transcriptional regulator, general stress-responsive regulator
MSNQDHPVATRMRDTLQSALQPTELEVIDESYKHAKHAHVVARAGTAGAPGETHFLIKVVAPAFAGKSRLDRHRMVNDLLAGEMGPDKVHALAIEARAPGE